MSQHKKIAFDISLRGHTPKDLLFACIKAGFTSFGFYQTFLHVDNRNYTAKWVSEGGKQTWNGLLTW